MADKKTVLVNGGNGGKLVPARRQVPTNWKRARISRALPLRIRRSERFQLHHDFSRRFPVHLFPL